MKSNWFIRASVIVFSLLLGSGYVYSRVNKSKLVPGSKAKILGTPNDLDSIYDVQALPATSQNADLNLLGGSKSAMVFVPPTVDAGNYVPTLPLIRRPADAQLLPGSKVDVIRVDSVIRQQGAQPVQSRQLLPGSKSIIMSPSQQQSVTIPISKSPSP